MKIVISALLILLIFISCKQKQTDPPKSLQSYTDSLLRESDRVYEKASATIDSSTIRLGLAIRYLDSNIVYGRKSDDYERKSLQAQVDYQATGEEKYYKQAVRFEDLRVKYAKKANRFHDSLQGL